MIRPVFVVLLLALVACNTVEGAPILDDAGAPPSSPPDASDASDASAASAD